MRRLDCMGCDMGAEARDPRKPLPAGSSISFRAVDAERGFGSSWRVVTKTNANDIYLEHIEGDEWIYSSFHDSGQTHYTTTKAARQHGGDETPWHFDVERERFAVAKGVFLLTRILIARSELSPDWQERETPEDVIEVPIDVGSQGVAFELYIVTDPQAVVEVQGQLIAIMECGGGAMLYLIATPARLDVDVQTGLQSAIAEIQANLRARGWNDFPVRAVVLLKDPDSPGLQRQVEVLIANADQTSA